MHLWHLHSFEGYYYKIYIVQLRISVFFVKGYVYICNSLSHFDSNAISLHLSCSMHPALTYSGDLLLSVHIWYPLFILIE